MNLMLESVLRDQNANLPIMFKQALRTTEGSKYIEQFPFNLFMQNGIRQV